jgi:hypothetical protein
LLVSFILISQRFNFHVTNTLSTPLKNNFPYFLSFRLILHFIVIL